MDYIISKISIKKGIEINYITKQNGHIDEYKGSFSEPARPQLEEAFAKLAVPVLYEMELEKIKATRFKPLSVDFKFNADDEMSAIVSGVLTMEETAKKTALNTPLVEALEVSETLNKALWNVYNEGLLYLQGDRAQGNLFSDVAAVASAGGEIVDFPVAR